MSVNARNLARMHADSHRHLPVQARKSTRLYSFTCTESWHVRQRILSQELAALRAMSIGPVKVNLGVPALVSVTLNPLPPSLRPVKRPKGLAPGGKQLFLYCAFDKKGKGGIGHAEKEAFPVWVQGEVASCELVFGNPFTFVLSLEVLGLESEGGLGLTLMPFSLSLPPRAPATAVTVQVCDALLS